MDDNFVIKLLQVFRSEQLPVDSVSFEIQEDGKFLLISIPASDFQSTLVGEKMALLLGNIIPKRIDEDSWMVIFTRDDRAIDSYSGGKLAD